MDEVFTGGDWVDNQKLVCDRCGKEIDGFIDYVGGMTAGLYMVGPETGWHKYANEGELIICDDCMFHNEEYIKDYGKHF